MNEIIKKCEDIIFLKESLSKKTKNLLKEYKSNITENLSDEEIERLSLILFNTISYDLNSNHLNIELDFKVIVELFKNLNLRKFIEFNCMEHLSNNEFFLTKNNDKIILDSKLHQAKSKLLNNSIDLNCIEDSCKNIAHEIENEILYLINSNLKKSNKIAKDDLIGKYVLTNKNGDEYIKREFGIDTSFFYKNENIDGIAILNNNKISNPVRFGLFNINRLPKLELQKNTEERYCIRYYLSFIDSALSTSFLFKI